MGWNQLLGDKLVNYSLYAFFLSAAMTNSRDERLQIMLSPGELALIDDFRFKHRMPTRAAAVRELLKLGLSSQDAKGSDGQKSSTYGVFGRGPDGHHSGENSPGS